MPRLNKSNAWLIILSVAAVFIFIYYTLGKVLGIREGAGTSGPKRRKKSKGAKKPKRLSEAIKRQIKGMTGSLAAVDGSLLAVKSQKNTINDLISQRAMSNPNRRKSPKKVAKKDTKKAETPKNDAKKVESSKNDAKK